MAEEFDVNRYALSLELGLNTAKAFKSLDQFEGKLNALEESVGKAAKAAFSNVEASLDKMAEKTLEIAKQQQHERNAMNRQAPKIEKLHDNLSADVISHDKIADSMAAATKSVEKQAKLLPAAAKHFKAEIDSSQQVLENLQDMTPAIDKKNKSHEEQVSLLQQTGTAAGGVLGVLGTMGGLVRGTTGMVAGLVTSWLGLKPVLESIANQELERVHAANFRFYGSMVAINGQTNRLTMEFGALRGEALEVYETLMNMRYPREELNKQADVVFKVHRATGVGIGSLAKYANTLRSVGVNAKDSIKHMGWLVDKMKQSGLNAQAVTASIEDAAEHSQTLTALYGNEAVAQFAAQSMKLKGLGQQMGLTAGQIQRMVTGMNTMTIDPRVSQQVESFIGMGITADNAAAAMLKLGEQLSIEFERAEQLGKDGMMGVDAIAGQLGLDREAAIGLMRLNDAMKTNVELRNIMADKNFKLKDEATADAKIDDGLKDAQNAFRSMQEYTAGTTAALNRMRNAMEPLLITVAEAAKNINKAIDSVGVTFERWIAQLGSWRDVLANVQGDWLKFAQYIAVGVAVVAGGAVAIATAGAIVGRGVGAMLGGIASGIGRLLGTIAQNALGVATITGAVIGFAYAAKLLGEATQSIKDSNGSFVLLTGTLAALGVGFVAVGYASNMAIPGIVTIAGALLAFGVTALMVGGALKLAEGSITAIGDTVASCLATFKDTLAVIGDKVSLVIGTIGSAASSVLGSVSGVVNSIASAFERSLKALSAFASSLSSQSSGMDAFVSAAGKLGKGINAMVAEMGWFGSGTFAKMASGIGDIGQGFHTLSADVVVVSAEFGKLRGALDSVADSVATLRSVSSGLASVKDKVQDLAAIGKELGGQTGNFANAFVLLQRLADAAASTADKFDSLAVNMTVISLAVEGVSRHLGSMRANLAALFTGTKDVEAGAAKTASTIDGLAASAKAAAGDLARVAPAPAVFDAAAAGVDGLTAAFDAMPDAAVSFASGMPDSRAMAQATADMNAMARATAGAGAALKVADLGAQFKAVERQQAVSAAAMSANVRERAAADSAAQVQAIKSSMTPQLAEMQRVEQAMQRVEQRYRSARHADTRRLLKLEHRGLFREHAQLAAELKATNAAVKSDTAAEAVSARSRSAAVATAGLVKETVALGKAADGMNLAVYDGAAVAVKDVLAAFNDGGVAGAITGQAAAIDRAAIVIRNADVAGVMEVQATAIGKAVDKLDGVPDRVARVSGELSDTVRAETVATVQVKDQGVGVGGDAQLQAAQTQIGLLTQILSKLTDVADDTVAQEIKGLMVQTERHLAGMGDGRSDLASDLNNWR